MGQARRACGFGVVWENSLGMGGKRHLGDVWSRNQPLWVRFSTLFNLCLNKSASIREKGEWVKVGGNEN